MSSPVPVVLSGCYKNYYKIQKTKCTECHNLMAATSIPRHMKTVHGALIGKQIKCDECGKCCQTKDRLLQHQKIHRLNPAAEECYSCDLCKYTTNFKPYLNNHKTRVHKRQPGLWICMTGTCKENHRSFINHQQMMKHTLIHEGVECPECKKNFGAKRNMKRHLKNVHRAQNDLSRNSNGSNTEENLNADPLLPAI